MEHAVNELVKLNDLKDPNKLDVGQEVELQSVAVLGIQPLFLDKDRNLVSVLEYILEYCNNNPFQSGRLTHKCVVRYSALTLGQL